MCGLQCEKLHDFFLSDFYLRFCSLYRHQFRRKWSLVLFNENMQKIKMLVRQTVLCKHQDKQHDEAMSSIANTF